MIPFEVSEKILNKRKSDVLIKEIGELATEYNIVIDRNSCGDITFKKPILDFLMVSGIVEFISNFSGKYLNRSTSTESMISFDIVPFECGMNAFTLKPESTKALFSK